jgi:putative NIF3 family GTP cyclohydrolase 1 type 2
VAWCTGGGQGYFEQAIDAGCEVYITGEASEQYTHIARETGVAFIAAGHHATERFGVQAVGSYLANLLAIEHQFIDIGNPV